MGDDFISATDLERCRTEIARLRRQLGAVLRERAVERELPAHWTITGGHGELLDWHVVIAEEALEPDVDVELVPGGLIVRARARRRSSVLVGLLPVPEDYDPTTLELRFELGTLHVRLSRILRGGPR